MIRNDGSFSSSLSRLSNKPFLDGLRYEHQQLRANRRNCHPDILLFEKAFVRLCAEYDIPVFAHSIRRDKSTQDRLFRDGFSRAKYGESPHNFGMAVDLIHGTKAWNIARKDWSVFYAIGSEASSKSGVQVDWGGHFRSLYDPAHWQLKNWRSVLERDAAAYGLRG